MNAKAVHYERIEINARKSFTAAFATEVEFLIIILKKIISEVWLITRTLQILMAISEHYHLDKEAFFDREKTDSSWWIFKLIE